MRIAYLSTFYPFRGGIAQFNALLYSEFEKLGHQVDAWTFTTQYPQFLFPGETQFVKDDDNAEIINSTKILSTINPLSWNNTAKKIKETNPEILIMKFWMPYFAPSLGYVANKLKKNTKIITILDNVMPHEKKIFDKSLTKYFLSKNHGFIVMSEKVKTDLLEILPSAKYILIPHPLYNHFGEKIEKNKARKILGIDPLKKTILFFGFIRDYKGLDLLIQAFDKLDNSYQLIIAGEIYGDFDKYDKLINSNSNKQNIYKFVKYISDKEVSTYFSASDVCVLPYKSATQSGITGISYHFDLPMIATNVGGLSEVVKNKITGLIVDKPDPERIAVSINEYFNKYNKNDFIQNIGELKKELSWNMFAQKIIEFSSII